MKDVEVLIVGGGAAGTTAAETYRAGGGAGEVLIVSDEPHPLYSRVLLPHAAKGKIDPERAFLKKSEWYAEKQVGLSAGRTVLRVDYRDKIVTLDGGEEIRYGKLVIAAGARPRRWNAEGADAAEVLHLQTYEDALALRQALVPGRRMAIVGSGFIAIEFAAACVEKGLKAVVLNRGPHFWTSMLGEGIGREVEAALVAKGVEVRGSAKVVRVEKTSGHTRVRLSDDDGLLCDLIGVGIGVEVPMDPFGDLRGEHGLKADAFLKAKHQDVWVAGDCAEYEDEVTGLRHAVGNWTNAVAQGRHVGKALLGETAKFLTLTSYSTAVFPGVNLIFMGGVKKAPGVESFERALGPARRLEFRVKDGRVVGAILLNAPDLRAACTALITSKIPVGGREHLLADPAFALDAF